MPSCGWIFFSSLKFNFLSNNLLCWIIWHLLASHFCLIFSVWVMFWSKKACSCGATEAEPQTGLSDLMTDHLTFSQFYQQICTQVKISGQDDIWLEKKKVGAVCNLPAFANQRLAGLVMLEQQGVLNLIHLDLNTTSGRRTWAHKVFHTYILSLKIWQTFPRLPIT